MAAPHHEHPHEHPELQRPPRWATAADRGDDAEGDGESGEADLLSLALLVFFVSLIGVVGALLLVPVLY